MDTLGIMQDAVIKLFEQKGLGAVVPPITPVSGGFLHRMVRVQTADRAFAVKQLNPSIMQRPDAMQNFRRAEQLETVLEQAGIPIVPAMTIDGSKMQACDGAYFYIFRWQDGQTTDWYGVTPAQCRKAGEIQGEIHAIETGPVPIEKPECSTVDWDALIKEAAGNDTELAALLEKNREMLVYAQDALNEARAALPGIACITDEDMDPKNVMWDGDNPAVIDLECLRFGNPVSSALQLSLQWAGVTICDLDFEKLKAFFDGYFGVYDNGFRDYGAVFGLAYTWIEWLVYNLKRALGSCADEAEREMGVSEVHHTVARIRYLWEQEAAIKAHFSLWFG